MRMLEKWAKTTGDGSYVHKRAKPKKKRKAKSACKPFFPLSCHLWLTLTVPSEEELAEGQQVDYVIVETMFTFESFKLVRGRLRCGDMHVEPSLLTQTPEIRKCRHHAVATDLY